MKQLILSLALALTIGLAQAQITVTNASFYAAGDSISLALIDSLSGVTISASGTGQVWDYSALSPDTVLGFRVRPANQGAGSASFPTADLVLANQLGETYYRISASAMSNLGFVGGFGIPLGQALTPIYNPPLVEQRAPMAYFDVNTANSALQVTFPASFLPDSLLAGAPIAPDSIRFSQTISRLDVVESWGELKLPGADYQVLRERRQTITDTKVEVLLGFFWIDLSTIFPFPGAGLDTAVAYHFFANGVKGPVAVFDVEPSNNAQVISVQYQDQILTSTHQPVVLARRLFRGPLPASNMLRFDLSILDRPAVVEIFHLSGQVVRRYDSAPFLLELEISGLPAGSYFYRVTDASGLLESGALLLQP